MYIFQSRKTKKSLMRETNTRPVWQYVPEGVWAVMHQGIVVIVEVSGGLIVILEIKVLV